MKVCFYYEYGEIPEIGTGHFYRTKTIRRELEKRGHQTYAVEDGIFFPDTDILVIDHFNSQKELILRAKTVGIKVVLIDGQEEDVEYADESISAIYNKNARWTGLEYMCFPTAGATDFYSTPRNTRIVFVGMGGFDKCNLAEFAVDILGELELNAIVARSINHNFQRNNMEFFEGENYFDALDKCEFAVTAGGLTLFQVLFYRMPCVAIPQYEHQKENIEMVGQCCLQSLNDKADLKSKIQHLMNNQYAKENLSRKSSCLVDGNACNRICDIIGNLR
jgi:spore coat polysaccharide biosynthesis predicted glycosyltransferase SpsG